MDAGALRYVVGVYKASGGREWVRQRTVYADLEVTGKTVAYSSATYKTPSVTFTLRRQMLAVGDMLVVQTRWYFVTAVTLIEDSFIQATGALVPVAPCQGRRKENLTLGNITSQNEVALPGFSGILAERYSGSGVAPEQGYNLANHVFILVVPKGVTLALGDIVDTLGRSLVVEIAYELGAAVHEYQVRERKDV